MSEAEVPQGFGLVTPDEMAQIVRDCDLTECTGVDSGGRKWKAPWQVNVGMRCERHRSVKDKAGKIRGMSPLKLAQRKLYAVFRYCEEKGIAIRVVVGKSRKQGISTAVAEYFYTRVVRDQSDALIVAHDKDTANWIFGMYARFYQHDDLPKPAPYSGGKVSTREMRFTDHDGHISVATARNEYAGTGRTPQLLHNSEGSKWERGAETKTALNQSIGDGPETAQVEESTFNGQEDCFLPVWKGAYDNSKLWFTEDEKGELEAHFEVTNHTDWNGYIALFISVLDDEDARKPFLDAQDRERFERTLDADERFLMAQRGASLEFLNWRRWAIKNKCRGNLDIFKQEYPTTPEEAIRASGRPRFDIEKLDRHPIEPGQQGRLEYGDGWERRVTWRPDKGGDLTIFRHPVAGHTYLIGVDTGEDSDFDDMTAELEERLDKSAFEVFDLDNGDEQVALFHAIKRPEQLGVPLEMLAHFYNDAFVVIESNAAGRVVCVHMAEHYDNGLLYHRDDWDVEKGRQQRAVGHKTTQTNRDIIIGYLADAITNNELLLHGKITVDELRNFVTRKRKKGSAREKDMAAQGCHDDHVMSCALARAGRRKAVQVFEMRKKMGRKDSVSMRAMTAAGRIMDRQRMGQSSITGY